MYKVTVHRSPPTLWIRMLDPELQFLSALHFAGSMWTSFRKLWLPLPSWCVSHDINYQREAQTGSKLSVVHRFVADSWSLLGIFNALFALLFLLISIENLVNSHHHRLLPVVATFSRFHRYSVVSGHPNTASLLLCVSFLVENVRGAWWRVNDPVEGVSRVVRLSHAQKASESCSNWSINQALACCRPAPITRLTGGRA